MSLPTPHLLCGLCRVHIKFFFLPAEDSCEQSTRVPDYILHIFETPNTDLLLLSSFGPRSDRPALSISGYHDIEKTPWMKIDVGGVGEWIDAIDKVKFISIRTNSASEC